MPPCCLEHHQFENRVLFLFEHKYIGKSMICICCKSYVCCSKNGRKQCSKGVSLAQNPLSHIQYEKVLKTNQPLSFTKRDFRVQKHQIFTYEQRKQGITSFYPKSLVSDNGINTAPISL